MAALRVGRVETQPMSRIETDGHVSYESAWSDGSVRVVPGPDALVVEVYAGNRLKHSCAVAWPDVDSTPTPPDVEPPVTEQ